MYITLVFLVYGNYQELMENFWSLAINWLNSQGIWFMTNRPQLWIHSAKSIVCERNFRSSAHFYATVLSATMVVQHNVIAPFLERSYPSFTLCNHFAQLWPNFPSRRVRSIDSAQLQWSIDEKNNRWLGECLSQLLLLWCEICHCDKND